MKNNLAHQSQNSRILKYILLIAVTVLAWFPILSVPFINDDYQILGYNAGSTLISIFRPFWTPDVSIYYWRPLGNMIHPLIINLTGFEPLPFRIVSLLLYAACGSVVLYACIKMGLSSNIAAGFAVLFLLLPSHELQVGWIADQGESLLAALLILSFISYFQAVEKNFTHGKYFYSFLSFFTASLLVKELAFAGILIPFIVYVAQNNNSRQKLVTYLKHTGIAIGILCIVLIYRFAVIGGSPFNSPNFSGSGPLLWIRNFIIYIPLAFFPPETLEFILYNSRIWWIDISVLLIVSTAVYLIVHAFRRLNKDKRNKFLAGIAWYVVFVIPALLSLMRWYVFTAAVGLIWSLAFIFEYYWDKLKSKKILASISIISFVLLGFYNYSVMDRWVSTGNKFQAALNSINQIKPEIKSDSLFVWCVPDKFERISMMKLGVQQSIQWFLKNKNLEVYSPLRAELTGRNSRIELNKKSDSVFVFHLYGGRFLPLGGKSRSIIEKENLSFSNHNVSLKISTFLKNNSAQSIATVKLKGSKYRYGQIYYNGKKFIMID